MVTRECFINTTIDNQLYYILDAVLSLPPQQCVGAQLLKTGQTISYQTGDDGDLEAGRPLNFFALAISNPFGNTNRFTAPDGSQTFTAGIVIDWSTFDGSVVLGYYRGDAGANRSWAAAVAWGTALNVAGFTGWRLTNHKELVNIIYLGGGDVVNYSPLSIDPNTNIWTSTTQPNDTTLAYRLTNQNGALSGASKAAGQGRTIACRNFTVTGTILT